MRPFDLKHPRRAANDRQVVLPICAGARRLGSTLLNATLCLYLVGPIFGQGLLGGPSPTPPPTPPFSGNDWRLVPVDIVASHLFDDPASTPAEQAAALEAVVDEGRNLTNSFAEILLARLLDRIAAKLPDSLPQDEMREAIERLVAKVIPERARPSLEDRVEAIFESLAERYPELEVPSYLLKETVLELVGPLLAQIQVRVDAIRLVGAWAVSIDVARRANRGNPLADRISSDQFEAVYAQLLSLGREQLTAAEKIRRDAYNQAMEFAIQQSISRSLATQSQSQERSGNSPTGSSPSGGGSYATSRPSSGVTTSAAAAFHGNISFAPQITDGIRYSGTYGSSSGGYYSYSGLYGGAEESPADVAPDRSQSFQREHFLAATELTSILRSNSARTLPARDEEARWAEDKWHLPAALSGQVTSRRVPPAIRHVKPDTEMIAFEYHPSADDSPLGFAFVADTSATLAPYSGAISTCTQTTFGLMVDDIVSEDGLLLYEFHNGGEAMCGAQWNVVIAKGKALISNPTVPRHQRFAPGTRLLAYQVFLPDRRHIREIFGYVQRSLAKQYEVEFRGEEPPETWIRDAELVRDRLIVRIAHRGADTTCPIKTTLWPRTYLVTAGATQTYQVPLQRGENYFTVRLPWYPGACSVDLTNGERQSLAFLQREIVPLGDTRASEAVGATQLRDGIVPLLGYQRGVRISGAQPQVYLPFASFKRRSMNLEATSGLIVNATVDRATPLKIHIHVPAGREQDNASVACIELPPGKQSVEIPWSRFSRPPQSGFGATLTFGKAPGGSATNEVTVHQVAIATDECWGRYLNIGRAHLDFLRPVECAVVAMALPSGSSVGCPLWIPLSPVQGCVGDRYGRLRVLATDSTSPVHVRLSGQQGTALAVGAIPNVTAYRPGKGWNRLKADFDGETLSFGVPRELLNQTLALRIGPPGKVQMAEGRSHLLLGVAFSLLPSLFLVAFLGWRVRSVTRRRMAMLGSGVLGIAIVPAFVIWQSSTATVRSIPRYWPHREASLELDAQSNQQAIVRPILGPTVLDPIDPLPGLAVGEATVNSGGPAAGHEVDFANFNHGRFTTHGEGVGGFNSPGGLCRAEVIVVDRDNRNEQVLQVTADATPGELSGLYLKSATDGVSLAEYRYLRLDVCAENGRVDWILEIKRGDDILASCEIAVPGNQWHVIDVPLLDLVMTEESSFDEIVFKFSAPSRLLLDNLRFVK